MNSDEKFWSRFGGMIRKARNDCPLTPEEAQKELDALNQDEHQPLTADELERSVEKILNDDFEPEPIAPDGGEPQPLPCDRRRRARSEGNGNEV